MKTDQSKHDASGRLKNGVFKEHYKDDTLMCVGRFRNGEWRADDANGKLIQITKHKAKQEKL